LVSYHDTFHGGGVLTSKKLSRENIVIDTNNFITGNSMVNDKPRFVFNCQRCGQCCEKDRNIRIFIGDIERWSKDGTVFRVIPNLVVTDENGIPSIRLERENDKCKMYDTEKKECRIYNSRPIICSAYPLKWNGSAYLIRDEECSGLNKGAMTQKSLEDIRNAAKKEYEEEERTSTNLPIIQAILLKDLLKKSESELNKLSEDEKEKIKKIFGKNESEKY
jgi:Fe-S-cluster containining protein